MNKGSWGKIRAFVDIQTEEGFVIKGFKLIDGINGLFVGFPSQKSQDEEYYDTVWAEKDLKEQLTQLVINEYGGDAMSPITPPDQPQTQETPEPYSDDDIPF